MNWELLNNIHLTFMKKMCLNRSLGYKLLLQEEFFGQLQWGQKHQGVVKQHAFKNNSKYIKNRYIYTLSPFFLLLPKEGYLPETPIKFFAL